MKKLFLQLSEAFDSVVGSWVSIWYVKIYVNLVSTEALAVKDIVTSTGGTLLMLLLIRYYKDVVSLKIVLISMTTSYLALCGLMLGPNEFLILSSILSIGINSTGRMFMNNIYAKNIKQNERAQFDNYKSVSNSLGGIIGSSLACISLLSFVDYKLMWLLIYLAFDLNLIALVWGVKTGWLKY